MFDEQRLAPQNGVSATVSIKDWIILDCIGFLNLIPILGNIAYIIIILVIAFGGSTAISLKNRVLATLIWVAIGIVISIVVTIFFGGALLATFGSLANL